MWFNNTQYNVNSFKALLLELSNIISKLQGNNFEKTLSLRGRKRSYFSRNKNELFAPERLGETNIYVETNLSANYIVKICKQMLAIFNYSPSDLTIEAS